MLDIRFIREHSDLISEASRRKHLDFKVEDLLVLDQKRLKLLMEVEDMRAEQNRVSEEITSADTRRRSILIESMRTLKAALSHKEVILQGVIKDWQKLMLAVPNIPDVSVPEGASGDDNVEVLAWGEKPKFDFPIKNHLDLMLALGLVDFVRGTKVHGFRGYFLQGEAANLSWAVWNYARDFFSRKNFLPIITPTLVKKEYFYGTGHLPNEAEDLYKTQDDDYLSGTAEVPTMAYHSEEILAIDDLPKRYLAFSPCYRREAGSHGKDTKGLIRVHEFYKLEQLVLCRADHAESAKIHEEINRNFEEFIESLELPYRRLLICGGDLGLGKVKQYDTEVWLPSEETYREVSSASYYHDFQTRRFNIRYQDGDKKFFAHSLNCTAVATPRLLAMLVENNQQVDGSIIIPKVLRPYFGQDKISKK